MELLARIELAHLLAAGGRSAWGEHLQASIDFLRSVESAPAVRLRSCLRLSRALLLSRQTGGKEAALAELGRLLEETSSGRIANYVRTTLLPRLSSGA